MCGWITRPDAAARARFLDTTRMLTRTELQTLFPEAEIWTKRFFGLAKGFVAVKNQSVKTEKNGASCSARFNVQHPTSNAQCPTFNERSLN